MNAIDFGRKRENEDSDVEEISHLRARPRIDNDDNIGGPGRSDALTHG